MNINALHDEWIPVTGPLGESTASIRSLLDHAHTLSDLGPSLCPVERESILRLLTSAAAVALRGISEAELDDLGDTGVFPVDSLSHLDNYAERFWLSHGSMPFLQEWSLAANPADMPLPLANLDPHTPGGSSSRWGLRPVDENPDARGLLRGLTCVWFHSKWSNGAPPAGLFKAVAGAPGYGGARDLTLHWIGSNLGLTLAAGVPLAWAEGSDLPAWLDQDTYPNGIALVGNPESLWRATYTPNRPILHWDEAGEPVGYVIGCVAGSARSVPALPTIAPTKPAKVGEASESTKSALAAVHSRDVTRAYRDIARRGEAPEIRKVTSRTHRLLSTEGAINWFKNDLGAALKEWGSDRVAPASHGKPDWRLGCYLEECDGTGGTRRRSDWVVVNSALLTLEGPVADVITVVLGFIEIAAKEIYSQMSVAAEGAQKRKPAMSAQAQMSLYASLDDFVVGLLGESAVTGAVSPYAPCLHVMTIASQVFAEQTEPLRNPSTVAQVEIARAAFASKLRRNLPAKPEEADA